MSVITQPSSGIGNGPPPGRKELRFDKSACTRFTEWLSAPFIGRAVMELRVMEADFDKKSNYLVRAERYAKTFSGWFSTPNALVVEAQRLNGVSGYVTTNGADSSLLALANERLAPAKSNTNNSDIRTWDNLLLDCDSNRKPGISATDQEMAYSLELRDRLLNDFPAIADSALRFTSGSGHSLVVRLAGFPINETNEKIVGEFVDLIAACYQDEHAKFDLKSKNPARIMTCIGTRKCKGDPLPDRPHRMTTIEHCPPNDVAPLDIIPIIEKLRLARPVVVPVNGTAQPRPERERTTDDSATTGRMSLFDRCTKLLETINGSVSGDSGHDRLYEAAMACVGMDMDEGQTRQQLNVFNRKCEPPWNTKEIEHKISQAFKNHTDPGCLARAPFKPHDNGAASNYGKSRGADAGTPPTPDDPQSSGAPNVEWPSIGVGVYVTAKDRDNNGKIWNNKGRIVAETEDTVTLDFLKGKAFRLLHKSLIADMDGRPFVPRKVLKPEAIEDLNRLVDEAITGADPARLLRSAESIQTLGNLFANNPAEYQVIKAKLSTAAAKKAGFLSGAIEKLAKESAASQGMTSAKPGKVKKSTAFVSVTPDGTPIGPDADTSIIPSVLKRVDDPHHLASVFLQSEEFVHPDRSRLVLHQDEFSVWKQDENGAYRYHAYHDVKDDLNASIEATLAAHAQHELAMFKEMKSDGDPPMQIPFTGKMGNDTYLALRTKANLTWDAPIPCWLGDPEGRPNRLGVIPLKNGIFDTVSETLIPPTPLFFSPYSLGYDHIKDAGQPKLWLEFLAQLFPENDNLPQGEPRPIRELRKWFGYLMTPNTRQQKILMIVGPKRSGKGTIVRVLSALIGHANMTPVTLTSLGERFGLEPLIGMLVAVMTDSRDSKDNSVALERLLTISGEDTSTIDRKNKTQVKMKLMARFVYVSNMIPKMDDGSGAFLERCRPIVLKRTFAGDEDTELTDKLLLELPQIFNWALGGLKDLADDGKFLIPESSKSSLADVAALSNPLIEFFDTVGEVKEDTATEWVDCEKWLDVYHAYRAWCRNTNHKALASNKFTIALKTAWGFVGTKQAEPGGRKTNMIRGVRLSAEGRRLADVGSTMT